MLKPIFLTVSFLISMSTVWADTTITLYFSNSGGEIQNLQITDNICNKTMYSGHFSAGGLETINGFCVRSSSVLATEISISADGNNESPSGPHR